MWLRDAIVFAGVVQLSILLASALVPHVLQWRNQLRSLDALMRHLIWVHGAYIVLTIVSLGLLCITRAGDLAEGSALARSVTAFIAVFWGVRLVIQCFVFDATPYLTSIWRRVGYQSLTMAFVLLTAIFTIATVH